MPRDTPGIGHNRPPEPEAPRQEVGEPKPMSHFPASWGLDLIDNAKLRDCCRNLDNLTGRYVKTDSRLQKPDLFVASCRECEAKHYRLAVGHD